MDIDARRAIRAARSLRYNRAVLELAQRRIDAAECELRTLMPMGTEVKVGSWEIGVSPVGGVGVQLVVHGRAVQLELMKNGDPWYGEDGQEGH